MNISYIAQSYFHQDFQLEAATPIDVVDMFRDGEPPETAEALRTEIVTLIETDPTEDDLSQIWLVDGGAQYDPGVDGITLRQWLLSVAAALTGDAPTGDTLAGDR